MPNLDWLWAAAIGAGGSIIGGGVGGAYAIRAMRNQWNHDRQTSRLDRAHQAAFAVAQEVSSLKLAIETWKAQQDSSALHEALNVFSRIAGVQGMAFADDELRRRVGTHTLLVAGLWNVAEKGGTAAPVVADVARRHSDAVVDALDAHVNDRPLPPYQAPPLDHANNKLFDWQPQP